jgi:hypothetical protein
MSTVRTISPRNCTESKEIAKGTLRSIIRESGLTVEEFANLL